MTLEYHQGTQKKNDTNLKKKKTFFFFEIYNNMVGTFSATSVGTSFAIPWSVHSVHSIGYPCFIMLKVRF